MRFWSVMPRSFSGVKSFGTGVPLVWGSRAVPAGGICAGVKYEICYMSVSRYGVSWQDTYAWRWPVDQMILPIFFVGNGVMRRHLHELVFITYRGRHGG